jgi:hypothetical protein
MAEQGPEIFGDRMISANSWLIQCGKNSAEILEMKSAEKINHLSKR